VIHYITTNGIGNAWVAAELRGIQGYGLSCKLHSMRAPHQNFFASKWAQRMNEATQLIYPMPVIQTAWSIASAPLRFRGRFATALLNALFSARESSRARVACLAHLAVACHWARSLDPDDVDLIHSQWIQSGGTIGWYAAWLLDKPFSFTGHAVDLFRDRSALKDKIRSADFIVAISEFHKQFYIDNGANPDKVHVVYCGIDLSDYPYSYHGVDPKPRILSFGRLVEKKGFDTLIAACDLLRKRGRSFECVIAGDGPEEQRLQQMVTQLDLQGVVQVTGKPLLQEEIAGWLGAGHVFAQPCCWSSDNDVDGIPRSLMEAMACGLPSVSTAVAGIPDLIKDGESGLLVPPKDAAALADALERLMDDEVLAQRLSKGGRKHIEEHFNLETCLQPLAELFRSKSPDAQSYSRTLSPGQTLANEAT